MPRTIQEVFQDSYDSQTNTLRMVLDETDARTTPRMVQTILNMEHILLRDKQPTKKLLTN